MARNRARNAETEARAIEIADLRWLLSAPQGRRLYRRIARATGLRGQTFHPTATEAAWMEGRRSIAVELDNDARRHVLDLYVKVLEEEQSEDDDQDD